MSDSRYGFDSAARRRTPVLTLAHTSRSIVVLASLAVTLSGISRASAHLPHIGSALQIQRAVLAQVVESDAEFQARIEELLTRTLSGNTQIRRGARRELEEIDDPRVVDSIAEVLREAKATLRARAALTLSHYPGDTKAINALVGALDGFHGRSVWW